MKPSPGGQQSVKIAMNLPHEMFSSLYYWRDGVVFFSHLASSPFDTWRQNVQLRLAGFAWSSIVTTSIHACEDLEQYWARPENRQLAIDTWGEAGWIWNEILCISSLKIIFYVHHSAWRVQDPMGKPLQAVPLRLYGDGAEVFGCLAPLSPSCLRRKRELMI